MKRTEDDLRAAFALAAQDAPAAEDVLARLVAAESHSSAATRPPLTTRRSWVARHAPLAAAAAVLVAIGVPLAIWHPSFGSTHSSASSRTADFGEKQAASAGGAVAGPESAAASAPAAANATAGVTVPGPAVQQSNGPSAGHTCRPDEVALTVAWTANGSALTGTLTAKNITSQACDLLVKPAITVLGTNGQPLGVDNPMTEEAKVGPQRLLPGASTSSTLTWSGWCGKPAGNQLRVSWGTGDATATATGPTTPACTSQQTIVSTWFDPLS